jgi:hypothetical protein
MAIHRTSPAGCFSSKCLAGASRAATRCTTQTDAANRRWSRPRVVFAFRIIGNTIAEIEIVADPAMVAALFCL